MSKSTTAKKPQGKVPSRARMDTFNYELIDPEFIREHFARGGTLPDILKHYGIDRVTFWRARVKRPEIAEAHKLGELEYVSSMDKVMASIVFDVQAKTSDRIQAYGNYMRYSPVVKQREREEARLDAQSLSNQELIEKINNLSNSSRTRFENLEILQEEHITT